MILLAAFCSLRMGELAALTRRDIDLPGGTVTIRVSVAELPGGIRHVGPPKSEAGRRTVTIPEAIRPVIAEHLETFGQPGSDGLVFVGPQGGVLRESNFVNDVWRPATLSFGLAHLHFHDLRHTGNTLAAATGASLKELMVRMGHASPKAALRYQHATRDRDAAIAKALSDLVEGTTPAVPTDRPTTRQRPAAGRRGRPTSPAQHGRSRPKSAKQPRAEGQGELAFPE